MNLEGKTIKRSAFAIAAAACAALLAAPLQAQIRTGELKKAYLKGKQNSVVGRGNERQDITCFYQWMIYSTVASEYETNLAEVHGELSFGYANLQAVHWVLAVQVYTNSPTMDATEMAVKRELASRSYDKKKELKKLGRELGRCSVPLGQIQIAKNDFGRTDVFLKKLFKLGSKVTYPRHVKDKKAWDAYAAAWRRGDVIGAANIATQRHDKRDRKTFHDNEFLVAMQAIRGIGRAGQMSKAQLTRAAYMDPDGFATLAGYSPADFKPRVVNYKSTASSLGVGARSQAASGANNKCIYQGGEILRTNTRLVSSVKATDTMYRETYEATTKCRFKPKFGG